MLNLRVTYKEQKNGYYYPLVVLLIVIGLVIFFLPAEAHAQSLLTSGAEGVGNAIAGLLNLILKPIAVLLGFLLTQVIELLIFVSQYNNFTNEPAIATAWVLLRDLANMGFVVLVVLVGFAEMFNISALRKIKVGIFLPKLVIGVVLINFSKGIIGLLIDISQIITLTFVAAFKDVAAANLISGLNLAKLFSENNFSNGFALFVNLAMINIILAVAIIIIAMIVALFVTRIVAFWILTVVSPVMFAASLYPFGKVAGYYGEWWDKFSKYLVMGPSLAFMVWLSFLILQNGTDISAVNKTLGQAAVTNQYVANAENIDTTQQIGAAATNAAQSPIPGVNFSNLLGFVMGAGALFATVMVAQQAGVAGGKQIAGAAQGALKKTGTWAAQGAGRLNAAARGLAAGGAGAGMKSLSNKLGGESTGSGRLLSTLSGHAYTVGSEGAIATTKKAGVNLLNRVKAKLNERQENLEQDYKDVHSGKITGWKAAKVLAKYDLMRRSPEKQKAKADEREEAEKSALSGKLSSQGAKAESLSEINVDLTRLKTDAEKYDYLKGAVSNSKLSDSEKKQVFAKMQSVAKNIGGGKLAEDLIFNKVVYLGSKNPEDLKIANKNFGKLIKLKNDNQEEADYGDEEAKKIIENTNKALAALATGKDGENNILSEKNRNLLLDRGFGRSDLLGEDGKINKAEADKVKKTFNLSQKEINDLIAKHIRRADLTDDNDNFDNKAMGEIVSVIGSDRLKGIFINKVADGDQNEKKAQWNQISSRWGKDAFKEKVLTAEELAAIAKDEEAVKTSLDNASDDPVRVAIVKDYLETGNENHARSIVNQTNVNVFNQGFLATDFNKLDSKSASMVLERYVSQPGLDKVQLSDILGRLSQREYVSLPESVETISDVLNLASVNKKQLKAMNKEGLDHYLELQQELTQATALGRTGLDVLMSKMSEAQKVSLEGLKDEVLINLKQGELDANFKLSEKKGKYKE